MAERTIEIVEVGPRDGLQNEAVEFSTADKLRLINLAIEAGIRRLEVASFVHPKLVPQMADAEALVAGLDDRPDVIYLGLALNMRGVERAAATRSSGRGIDEIGCVAITSDTFGQKNQGQTSAESLAASLEIMAFAKAEGMEAGVTISAAYGCPFEGEIAPDRVVDLAKRLADAEPCEISIADTIGVAVPAQVTDVIGKVKEAVPHIPLRAHFHNTRNTGIANAWAALEAGAVTIDASLGGLGGCPFAPRATGNIATEDLVYMLQRSGVETGIDLDKLISATGWVQGVLGRQTPAMVSQAGGFPKAAAAEKNAAE
ncbi:MAG: hydroxymethylglutaryl-CoA lyase [Proteobacteria bacterium]|nr:hydroxymethylglutaryl-CoA lyase [Pseudomonadota bacterium]